ncbi:MAG: hypothetical protein ACREOO_14150 [bacterium]
MLIAEQHRVETQEIAGVRVSVQSYKIGDRFYCHVSNFNPGATIARAEAATCEEALQLALQKARQKLGG